MKKLFSIIAFMLVLNIGNAQVRIGFTPTEIESELKQLHVPFVHAIDSTDNSVMFTKFFNGNSDVIHYYLHGKCITTIIILTQNKEAEALKAEYNQKYYSYAKNCWMINNIRAEMYSYGNKYFFTYN